MPLDLDFLAVAGTALSYGAGPSVPWARIILAFLLCAGLAVAAIAFLRWRAGQGGPGTIWRQMSRGAAGGQRELELVERLALSPNAQLMVVRWGEKKLLVLASSSGAQVLSEEAAAQSPERSG
jgi:hypothetical protein